MKIEEAKNKWCPFVRVSEYEGGSSYNKFVMPDKFPQSSMCIANKCMLWEWDYIEDEPGTGYCGMGNRSDSN